MNAQVKRAAVRRVSILYFFDHAIVGVALAACVLAPGLILDTAPWAELTWVAAAVLGAILLISWFRYEECRSRLIVDVSDEAAFTVGSGACALELLTPLHASGTALGVRLEDQEGAIYYYPWRWQIGRSINRSKRRNRHSQGK